MGLYSSSCVIMDYKEFLWVLIGPYSSFWILMGPYRYSCVTIGL